MTTTLLVALAWLLFVTFAMGDVQMTVAFIGRRTTPRVRALWLAMSFGIPVLSLAVIPELRWLLLLIPVTLLLHVARHLLWRIFLKLESAPAGLVADVAALCQTWRIPAPDRVMIDRSDRMGPAVVGLWRQTLILPPDFPAASDEGRAILAHELAHVAERDPLANWCIGVGKTLLGWHPIIRQMLSQMELELELAADEQAAAWTGSTRNYALTLARWGLAQSDAVAAPAGAMLTGQSQFMTRMRLLTDSAAIFPPTPAWIPNGLVRPDAGVKGPKKGRPPLLMHMWVPVLVVGYSSLFYLLYRWVL